MEPDPLVADAVRRIQRIEKLLVDKGVATTEELDPTPPEYTWLARVMNHVTERSEISSRAKEDWDRRNRGPEDPT